MSERVEPAYPSDPAPQAKVGKSVGTVLIDGASGYVGSHLTYHLRGEGVAVRSIVRPKVDPSDRAILDALSAKVFPVDLLKSSNLLEKAFDGVEIAVHLIGSVAPAKSETLRQIHV